MRSQKLHNASFKKDKEKWLFTKEKRKSRKRRLRATATSCWSPSAILYLSHNIAQGYKRQMEDMKRQMEAEMNEMEEKLRTAAKIMVLKEREYWKSDRETMRPMKSIEQSDQV